MNTVEEFLSQAEAQVLGEVFVFISRSISQQALKEFPWERHPRIRKFEVHSPLLTWDYAGNFMNALPKATPELIVGIGGGSVLDLMKIVKHERRWECPLWAVPTTAGTGSEATPFATIYRGQQKESLQAPSLVPTHVLFEESLLRTLPLPQRWSTASDAMVHAVESVLSVGRTPDSLALAWRAIPPLSRFLKSPEAWDVETIRQLQQSAFLAGQAIAQTRTTLAHAFSYSLSGHKLWPHGFAVLFHLPWVISYALEAKDFELRPGQSRAALLKELDQLATILKLSSRDELEKYFLTLAKQLIPVSLLQGLSSLEISGWIQDAAKSNRSENHPRPFHEKAIHRYLHEHLEKFI